MFDVRCPSFLSLKQCATTTTTVPCPDGFYQKDQGCFYVVKNRRKDWRDAEAVCQTYGSNVHLATLDTQQVGSSRFWHKYIWSCARGGSRGGAPGARPPPDHQK